MPRTPIHYALAAKILQYARAEIGKGESTRNNQGEDIDRYRGYQDGDGPWCAAFVYYVLSRAFRSLELQIPFGRIHGAKKLYRWIVKCGEKVDTPEPGDIVCWHRGKSGSWTGHIGIVDKVESDGTFISIEGNVGKFPAKVKRIAHDPSYERLVGFCRFVESSLGQRSSSYLSG
jgi:hypothetical protein